jgi:hypothetical protein
MRLHCESFGIDGLQFDQTEVHRLYRCDNRKLTKKIDAQLMKKIIN